MAVTATPARAVKATAAAKDRPPIPQLMSRPPLRTVYAGETPEVKGPGGAVATHRYETYLMEEQPNQRLYHFVSQTFRLWMPWTYYVIRLSGWKEGGIHPMIVNILWRPEQLTSTDQRFFAAGMPNLHGSGTGQPCFDQAKTVMGEEMEKLAGQYGSLFDWAIAFLYHQWWDAAANTDLYPINSLFHARLAKMAGFNAIGEVTDFSKLFEAWETLDRGQVLDMPMNETQTTVNSLFPKHLKSNAKIGLI